MNWLKSIAFLGSFLLCQLAHCQSLSEEEAVLVAEKFISENGYTNLDPTKIKKKLDFESMEFTSDREKLLSYRRNSLASKAIGAIKGSRSDKDGWSVAFDYQLPQLKNRDICRVVTMSHDGAKMTMQHVEGVRRYFVSSK